MTNEQPATPGAQTEQPRDAVTPGIDEGKSSYDDRTELQAAVDDAENLILQLLDDGQSPDSTAIDYQEAADTIRALIDSTLDFITDAETAHQISAGAVSPGGPAGSSQSSGDNASADAVDQVDEPAAAADDQPAAPTVLAEEQDNTGQ